MHELPFLHHYNNNIYNKVFVFVLRHHIYYLIESFDKMRFEDLSSEEGAENAPRDLLYEQALSLVIDTGTASTTFLQRKLKIGYARAASLMDELEEKKVISSQEGAKPRRVLVDPKEISSLKPNKTNDTE